MRYQKSDDNEVEDRLSQDDSISETASHFDSHFDETIDTKTQNEDFLCILTVKFIELCLDYYLFFCFSETSC